ncbi:MAG: hypothetical protein P8R54_06945 [Myxococcota bacterium]|nr:hypothetical protein [Myxococcota bacterium]
MMSRGLTLVSLLMLSGCFTTKMHYGDVNPARTDHRIRIQHTFLWGLVSPGSTNLSRVCDGQPVVSVRSRVAGLGLLGLWLTAGIYAPVTVTVVCSE